MDSRLTDYVVRAVALSLACFHIYTAVEGTFYPFVQRSIPLLLSVILVFLVHRASGQDDGKKVPFYDWVLVLLTIPVFGYIGLNSDYLQERWPLTTTFAPTWIEIVCGVVAAALLLEATRRVMGWALVITSVIALFYTYLGEYIPWGLISHRGFTLIQILDFMYLTLEGVWGVAIGVAATYIVLFIIFGAFAERAGAAEFCIEFCNALAGHTRGGPAKVAIFSSALIGSVTGSTVANVYTTGQFTIPLMKRLGYKPRVAGAVEALASNGGQIMPPVLGAAAFLIAAYTGVSYVKIAFASLIPAFLYFLGLFWSIHLEAHKTGLKGIPKEEKPSAWRVFVKGGHLLSPLAVLIGFLVYGFSPMKSAVFAILFTVAVSWLRKETRLGPSEIVEALEKGARNAVMIIVTCGVVGFIVGAFTLTGLALNASSAIISLAGGNFFFILVFVGVACIVLGMGMNTVAAYVLVSVVGVPALMMQGVDPLVANMFVFYFALLSHITPPVCLAIFAAASIAGANVWETAFTGMKMGVVGYLLPFLVVLYPPLLIVGTPQEIVLSLATTAFGSLFMISSIQGWLFTSLNVFERVLALATGVAFLWPAFEFQLVAVALGIAVVGVSVYKLQRSRRHNSGIGRP